MAATVFGRTLHSGTFPGFIIPHVKYDTCFYQLYIPLILFNTFLVFYEKIHFIQKSVQFDFYVIRVLLPASSLWGFFRCLVS